MTEKERDGKMKLIDVDILRRSLIEQRDKIWKRPGTLNACSDVEKERYRTIVDVLDAIRYTKAADAVLVRHGKWEYTGRFQYRCSVCCNAVWTATEMERMGEMFKRYCPCCGARTDGEAE